MNTHRDIDNFEKSKEKKERSNNKFNRKTFYHVTKSGKSRKVTASGVIYYVIDRNDKVYWLMRKFKGKFEDLGGITKKSNRFPLDAGINATWYRTNGMFFGSREKKHTFIHKIEAIIKKYNKNKIAQIYIDESKYLLFMMRIPYYFYKNSKLDQSFVWLENFEDIDIHPRLSVIQECPDLTNQVIVNNIKLNKKKGKVSGTKKEESVDQFPPLETSLPESSEPASDMCYKEALCNKSSQEEDCVDQNLLDSSINFNNSLFSTRLDELCKQVNFNETINQNGTSNIAQISTGSTSFYRPKSNSMPNTPKYLKNDSPVLAKEQFSNYRPVSYSEPNTQSHGGKFNGSIYNLKSMFGNYRDDSFLHETDIKKIPSVNNSISPQLLLHGDSFMKPVHDQPSLTRFDQKQISNQQSTPVYNHQQMPAYNQQHMSAYNQPPMPAYNQPYMSAYNQPPMPAYNQQPMPAYNQPPMPVYNQPSIHMQGKNYGRGGYMCGQQPIHVNGFNQSNYQSHDMSVPPGFERTHVTTGRLGR